MMGSVCSRRFKKPDIYEFAMPPSKHDKYDRDPELHYDQLNTEWDQEGQSVINAIVTPRREVVGQPAKDMKLNLIPWNEMGFKIHHRPCPHDFPGFENIKATMEEATRRQNKAKSREGIRDEMPSTVRDMPSTVQLSQLSRKQNPSSFAPLSSVRRKKKDDSPDSTQQSIRQLQLEAKEAKELAKKAAREAKELAKIAKKRLRKEKKREEKKKSRSVENPDLDACSL